ncbi:MAG: primosomal protein N' [Alphaproteobacteria bacterium]|nr:primosomal protein N' [Alphaproteobacteria bacterium]
MSQISLFGEEKEEKQVVPGGKTVSVLVPYPVEKAYDYAVPKDLDLQAGDYICVPLGNREITGVVWGEGTGDVEPKKLKSVISKYPLKSMSGIHRKFIDWVANYTLSAKGMVLKMSLSAPAALNPPKPSIAYKKKISKIPDKLPEKRKKVLEVIAEGQAYSASELAEMAGCTASVIKGMAQKNLLEMVEVFGTAPCSYLNPDAGLHIDLSEQQNEAAQQIIEDIRADKFSVSLLDGVTGAGKTEVYFEGVVQALKNGKQVLILLPEIALSNAFLDRFKKRFGCLPALWHSGLGSAQRRETWRGVASGKTKVVIGARSALFLPYQDLGLIVVDEEHDPAYKQEDGVIYHARDMAVLRAHLGNFPIVLVSATPSLETIHNIWEGKYKHLELPARYGGAQLPDIALIDMREDKLERQKFLSRALIKALKENLEEGNQSLLFLNRRGYAPLTLCRGCGHRMECPRCTAWLVEHKRSGKLHCHHCDYHMKMPKTCPSCNEEECFVACGPGVERIFEEVREYFPDARVMVLASDTAESHEDLKSMLKKISDGEVDIIIGTQIMAKGHHFPNLTLVGVVDADLGLQGGDLRAAERTYQLLHQVSGRAGREAKKGRVLLQSWMPEHRIMKALAAGEREAFFDIEASEREMANMPPYSRLAGIIISGREEHIVRETAEALGKISPQGANEHGQRILTLGPAPAPFARLRGKYRYRLLVCADKNLNVQKTISNWISQIKIPSNIRIYVDIDPQSFL